MTMLKSKQDVQTHYTNQHIKNALATLKQHKYEMTFSQMKELREFGEQVCERFGAAWGGGISC